MAGNGKIEEDSRKGVKDVGVASIFLEYLKSKKRDCMAEILEILSRYGLSSASELEEAIGEDREG
jgi:hypothetical protein